MALTAFFVPLLLAVMLLSVTSAEAQQYEAGVVNANHGWKTVSFAAPFAAPPVVVAGPVEYGNADPATVRVRNVTANSFQIRVDEWDYQNGAHPLEEISYIAMEEGIHSIGGLTWEAGRISNVRQAFTTVNLAHTFESAPVVVCQIETVNNIYSGTDPEGLIVRMRNVAADSLQVRILDEQLSATSPTGEDLGYLAVSEGSGYIDGQPLLVVRTGNVVPGADVDGNGRIDAVGIDFPASLRNPVFVAAIQSHVNGEPVSLRQDNLTATSVDLFVEEEKSLDDEVNHGAEDVGMIVIGEALGASDAKIHFERLIKHQSNANVWHSVTFPENYSNPVVVMGPVLWTGNVNSQQPCTLRVRNITSTGFEYQVDEWEYLNGSVSTTHHHYAVMEAGVFDIGGVLWQAGVKSGVNHAWKVVDLEADFGATPVVLAQCATTNDPDAAATRIRLVDSDSFEVFLDEQQLGSSVHSPEDVHYISMLPGASAHSEGGVLYLYDAQSTLNTISDEGANDEQSVIANGIDVAWERVPFRRVYDTTPLTVAGMQTGINIDPAALRYKSLGRTGFDVRVEEEQSYDQEVNHSNEVVGYIAATTYIDADNDGLPDAWENAEGESDPDADPDDDGLSNREEFLTATDPGVPNTPSVSVYRERSRAYENINYPASFIVTRSDSLHPLNVYFNFGGADTADDPAANGSDYIAVDGGGNPMNGVMTIPEHVSRARIYIRPVNDDYHEYLETLEIELLDSPGNYNLGAAQMATVTIADATNSPVNDTLFIGYFRPELGVTSNGSGVATLLMNGSNTSARLTTNYSVETDQTNAHIHRAGPGPSAGSIVEPLPMMVPANNYQWIIDSAADPSGGPQISRQNLVDSLYRQANQPRLYANVHTVAVGSGEIWALFGEAQGSVNPPANPGEPPAIEQFDITTAAGRAELRRDVTRFLTQATFGPTTQSVARLYSATINQFGGDRMAAYEDWFDDQMLYDQTRHADLVIASDFQEWVLRKHFDYEGADAHPDITYTGTSPMPDSPTLPTTWPIITGQSIRSFNSLDSATWRTPNGPYPLTQTEISQRNLFSPNLNEPRHQHRRRASWTIWAGARDQLRQRLGFAWQEIFAVSDDQVIVQTRHVGAARWIDRLAENSDDTFRQMIEDVTYSPIMGKFLSSLQNGSEDATGVPPDENYAREIMQLFSIGLVNLWPDGTLQLQTTSEGGFTATQTYDNTDIAELARVFTGLSYSRYSSSAADWETPQVSPNRNNAAGTIYHRNTITGVFNRGAGNRYYGATYEYPMHIFGHFHDLGVKTLNSGGANQLVVDNTSMSDGDVYNFSLTHPDPVDEILHGYADIADVHDWLAEHPNTAPFICYRLIQRLVTSNPSRGYVQRVAKVFKDNRDEPDQLALVSKAILLDYEARTLAYVDDENYGKKKEPLIAYLQAVRALNASSGILLEDSGLAGVDLAEYGYHASQANNFYGPIDYSATSQNSYASNLSPTRFLFQETDPYLGQTPLKPPSVFNWFLPDFSPDGPVSYNDLVAPEFQISTETSVVSAINFTWNLTWYTNGQSVNPLGTSANGLYPQKELYEGAPGVSDYRHVDNVVVDFGAWIAKYNNYNVTDEASRDRLLVNELDRLLTGGNLAKRYPLVASDDGAAPDYLNRNPREAIVHTLTESYEPDAEDGGQRSKVATAFYLITTSPEYLIQK